MSFVIVPNVVSDAINAALDMALEEFPEAATDREFFYQALLAHFDQYGEIPDFTLQKEAGK